MDYTELTQRVQDWSENTNPDFIDNIPVFIDNACRTIAREVDGVGLSVFTTVSATPTDPRLTLPTDCYVLQNVVKTSAGRSVSLKHRPYDILRFMWPEATSVGSPKYYDRIDHQTLYMAPTPTNTNPVELRYVTVTAPSALKPTPYVLQYHPNLLLYRVMVEANLFQMDMENVQMFQGFYDRERDAASNEGRRNRRDNSMMSGGPLNTNISTQNTLKGDA